MGVRENKMVEAKRPRGRPPKQPRTGRKYNPKSRENLRQYSEAKNAQEKDSLIRSITEEVDLEIPEEMLEVIIPTKKVFSHEEQKRFIRLLKFNLKEIAADEKISFADIQSVAELCKNIILEDRLLADSQKKAKEDPIAIVGVMATVEKLKKRNATLTETLATNRSARIDPRQGKNITVLDVLYTFDNEVQEDFQEKLLAKLIQQEKEVEGLVRTTNEDMIT